MGAAEKAARHYRRGLASYRQGRLDEAARDLRKAVDLDPANADRRYDLAVMLQDQGKYSAAEVEYRRVLARQGESADALSNLALCMLKLRQAAAAEPLATRATELAPQSAEVRHNLGVIERALARPAAVATLRRAAALKPNSAAIWNDLGEALLLDSEYAEADECISRALASDPGWKPARANRATLLVAYGRLSEAEALLGELLAEDPDFVPALVALALTLLLAERFDECMSVVRRGLEVAQDPSFWFILGNLRNECGYPDDTVTAFHEALRIWPEYTGARFALAMSLLALGRRAEGWALHEARPTKRALPEDWRDRELGARNLADSGSRSVLLVGEQGLGDELFFLRFAPQLASRGVKLAYWGNGKLRTILERTGLFERVQAYEEQAPAADLFAHVGSLPWILADREGSVHPAPLALTPEPGRVDRMRQLLRHSGAPPFIGLTWHAGHAGSRFDAHRMQVLCKRIAPALIGPHLAAAGGTVVVVQRNPAPEDMAALADALGQSPLDLSSVNDDLDDMLALMSVLDDYVGVSNTNMHLRAGTGHWARVLVPMPQEWRWQSEGTRSPWYPGFTVYRQAPSRSWDDALARLRGDLTTALAGPQSGGALLERTKPT